MFGLHPIGALLSGLALTACQEQPSSAAASAEPSEFVRFVSVGEDEGRFETAIHSYEHEDGARVALIAAVHIADAAHYAELQREFTALDVVLYELVAEEGDRPVKGQKRGGLISMLQNALKNGLELEFQLDAVDYSADNFVHADLTPDAMLELMDERGESFFTTFWNLAAREMGRLQGREGEEMKPLDLVSAFQRREGRHLLRMAMARQLADMEVGTSVPGTETVLLEGRNERAIEVLREQLAAGHEAIGIYYGAAHMTGIERTLVEELGFTKAEERWLVAWDLTKRKDPERSRD